MRKDKILLTGANGQVGSVLTKELRKVYGMDNVLATDIRPTEHPASGPFELLNVMDTARFAALIDKYQITQIYHLVAILSAKGEANPRKSWDLNINSLLNVLDLAHSKSIRKIFFPSSIAVFGPDVPKDNTPQDVVLAPTTVYGISKAAGENWCNYYFNKYDLDIRSLRYPGVIGYQGLPGGGTTDYAVDIFHSAVKGEDFTCFLRADTALPMIYMPDSIRATIELMEAPAAQIKTRTSYNLNGMSFTPAQLSTQIKEHLPGFKVSYQPDFRQGIADSWPNSLDDSAARSDWGWQEQYDLAKMTTDMIYQLNRKYEVVKK